MSEDLSVGVNALCVEEDNASRGGEMIKAAEIRGCEVKIRASG